MKLKRKILTLFSLTLILTGLACTNDKKGSISRSSGGSGGDDSDNKSGDIVVYDEKGNQLSTSTGSTGSSSSSSSSSSSGYSNTSGSSSSSTSSTSSNSSYGSDQERNVAYTCCALTQVNYDISSLQACSTPASASDSDRKALWRKAALKCHPDKTSNTGVTDLWTYYIQHFKNDDYAFSGSGIEYTYNSKFPGSTCNLTSNSSTGSNSSSGSNTSIILYEGN